MITEAELEKPRLRNIPNALGVVAGLIALCSMLGAAGMMIAGGPHPAGPHLTGHQQLIEAAQLVESETEE